MFQPSVSFNAMDLIEAIGQLQANRGFRFTQRHRKTLLFFFKPCVLAWFLQLSTSSFILKFQIEETDKRPRDNLISITVNNVLLNFGHKQTKNINFGSQFNPTIQFFSLVNHLAVSHLVLFSFLVIALSIGLRIWQTFQFNPHMVVMRAYARRSSDSRCRTWSMRQSF